MRRNARVCWIAAGILVVNAAAFAAEQTITLRDWTGRGFAPEVVGYEVPAAGAEKLRVAGPDGKPLPVQIAPGAARDRALLLFPADLPRDATVAYQVSERGESGPAEAGAKAEGETIVLFNSLLAVRVPKAQERTGTAVKDLPPPILAFQSAGGPWRGAGKMLGEAKAETFRVIQAAAGPVRAEIRYEIDYAGGGTYRCTVRVDAREPIAEVIEEYDLQGAPQDAGWELDLAAGLAAAAGRVDPRDGQRGLRGRDQTAGRVLQQGREGWRRWVRNRRHQQATGRVAGRSASHLPAAGTG